MFGCCLPRYLSARILIRSRWGPSRKDKARDEANDSLSFSEWRDRALLAEQRLRDGEELLRAERQRREWLEESFHDTLSAFRLRYVSLLSFRQYSRLQEC